MAKQKKNKKGERLEDKIQITNESRFGKYDLEVESPDKVLRHEGLEYYDKMLDTDAHVYSIINTRKMGASSFPYQIIEKNDSPFAREQKEFIEFLLSEIPIENHFFDILDAIPKGFSVHEIISRNTTRSEPFKNKKIISRLVFHPQDIFTFKVNGKIGYDIFFKDKNLEEKQINSNLVLHAIFDSHNPNGKPLLEKLYWYYWFKKETGFKFWSIFLERFGGPTAIMKYPSGETSTELQSQALDILEDLQNEMGVAIPDSFSLEFAKVSSGDISYQDMIDACNAEMSKAVLGATQTVEEGRRGSYALSRTHTDVRAEYKYHDTGILRRAIQKQIIDPYTKINYANPFPPIIKFVSPLATSPEVKGRKLENPLLEPEPTPPLTGETLPLQEPNPDHKIKIEDGE